MYPNSHNARVQVPTAIKKGPDKVDQEVRGGQENFLLIRSREVSVVKVTLKMILKKQNNRGGRLAQLV